MKHRAEQNGENFRHVPLEGGFKIARIQGLICNLAGQKWMEQRDRSYMIRSGQKTIIRFGMGKEGTPNWLRTIETMPSPWVFLANSAARSTFPALLSPYNNVVLPEFFPKFGSSKFIPPDGADRCVDEESQTTRTEFAGEMAAVCLSRGWRW
jgi:hypothetical protein